MRRRKKASAQKKIGLLVAAAVVLAVSDVLILNIVLAYDEPAPAAKASVAAAADPSAAPAPAVPASDGAPVRIRIPGIGVNAAIVKVALAADGSMDVPKRPKDTAWYMLGPKPGETGSAVIAGHVNWLYGAIGVFQRLSSLKPGSKISVQDDKGAIVSFVVRESRTYDPAADATGVFSSNDGKAHLNLVTCVGTWDKRAKQYTKRLVVFADKITK